MRVYSSDEEEGVRVAHYLVEFRYNGEVLWTEKLIAPSWDLEGHTRIIEVQLQQKDAQTLPGDYEVRVVGMITPDRKKRYTELGKLFLRLSAG